MRDLRNRLLRYSKNISDLAEEVRLCQDDLERQSHDEFVHYAVDTNILFFGVSPHRQAELGRVFYDDGADEERTLALSLRRFLFEKLASFDRPFLISHGHDAEARWAFEKMILRGVHEQIELEDELSDISIEFAARLKQASDPTAVFEQVLPRLTNLLAYDSGPTQDYRRFNEIVEEGRVQRLSLAFSRGQFFNEIFAKDPDLFGKFAVPRNYKDQIAETLYRENWHKHLSKAGVRKNPYAMRCDVSALARIQLINERLRGTGHRLLLITADNAVINASKTVQLEGDENFRDCYVRHPKAFLAAQSVLAPEDEMAHETQVSSTITLLDDWIKLLSDMMPVLEEIRSDDQGDKEKVAQLDELADNIKTGWRGHVDALEKAHASTSSTFREMISRIAGSGDKIKVFESLRSAARGKVAEVHETWADFFEQILSTSYFVFEQAKLPIRPRNVPPIYFGRFNEAYAIIQRISGDPKAQISLDDIRALESSDDCGYTFCLSFSALFASLGKWQTAELVANHALLRVKEGASTVDDLSGREAFFVRAIAQRLQARSAAGLMGAKKSLEQSESCLDHEELRKDREWLRLRYRSEEAALELAGIFLEQDAGKRIVNVALKSRLKEICKKISEALRMTKTITDDWIRQQVTESFLTNLFIASGILKANDLVDEEIEKTIFDIVPVFSDYLTSKPDFGGFWRSYLGRVYFLFAQVFYFPATKTDIKLMRDELIELQGYYSEYRPLQVMPYDDQRFAQLFEIIGKRLKRLSGFSSSSGIQ